MFRLAWMLLAWPAMAQDVYISTLGEPLPSEQYVMQAIDEWNAALGIEVRYAGYTNQPCVDGSVTFRMPSTEEWIAAQGDRWLIPAATVFACQPEQNYTGLVVLFSPVWLDQPFVVYLHEAGHAIGARHVMNESAIMFPYQITATEITPMDIQAVIDCTPWLGTDGILRIQSLSYQGARLGATLWQDVTGAWSVLSVRPAAPLCLWNYELPNGNMTLWGVYAKGKRYGVQMAPIDGKWRVVEVREL